MSNQNNGISIVLLTMSALVCIAMVAIGAIGFGEDGADSSIVNVGMLGIVIVASAAAVVLSGSSQPAETPSELDSEDRVIEQLKLVQQATDRMCQHAALSDDARRVLNRTRERELLCRAIEEDIRSQDWSAAQVLVTELASRFGYEQDAERFRMLIERARAEGLDMEINDAIKGLDHLIVQRHWDEAITQAESISASFPISPRVKGLRDRVLNARTQYKEEIERRFLLAAQAERVDEAMEIMGELDHYLTEDEAEPFREVARGVIGKAKQNLGAAFKLACQDKQWGIAVSLGQQINEQFPNSRMSQEVAGLMPQLRQRSQEEQEI
jgi:hypothetical protein